MCGIVGYSGFRQATEVLLEGLRNLEYRGYDSAGISVFEDGVIRTVKSQGRIQKLEEKLAFSPLTGTCGIAIPVGLPMASPATSTPIPTVPIMYRCCITASSKTIWNSRKNSWPRAITLYPRPIPK